MPEQPPDPRAGDEPVGGTAADAPGLAVTGVVLAPADDAGADGTGPPATARRRRKRDIGLWLATAWLTVLIALSVLAPYLPFVKDPSRTVPGLFRNPPSREHWFGGDEIGRDMFARVLHGGRISLFIAVTVVALGFVVGGALGLLAGYYRGRIEQVIVALMDVLLAFPALILALALVAFIGGGSPDIRAVIISLSVLSVAPLARITRATTLAFAQREFVLAARALGAKDRRIIVREILPNVIPPMASFALVVIAIIIVVEGALSFLGLSVSAPQPTWGNMINEGRRQLERAPHISLIPAGVMFVTILAFNYIGDALRSRFDVRESGL